MDASQLFLQILDERSKTYSDEIRNCRMEFSEAAVHDLRVTARRLLAALQIARSLEPQPRLQKARRALKDQIDDLDDLRDVQVMLAEVSENTSDLPELQPLQVYLRSKEKSLLRAAHKQVNDFNLAGFSKRMTKIQERLAARLPKHQTQVELLQVVDLAFGRATQLYGQIDAAQPSSIHRLRLAFKKFRYMVEIIQPLLPDFPKRNLKRMHDYQAMMGEIQDAQSFLNIVGDYSEQDASYDPQPARHYFEQLNTDLIAAYLDDKGELLVFWRPTPEKPFPWNKRKVSTKTQKDDSPEPSPR
ncbi:MAG TPA: CHAD domain-containing protein [Anaerolineales bacterium]|nr:CHAD domain-containing protein [Anaerolineales bacterium]